MSIPLWRSFALALALSFTLAAGVTAADPLVYSVVRSESNANAAANVIYAVNVTPDFTEVLSPPDGEFPITVFMAGSSNTQPAPGGTLTADVGLPGNFNNGANGITISQWEAQFPQLPGTLSHFGFFTVPLDLLGANQQFTAFQAQVSNLQVTLDSPVSSDLTPTGNPGEWLWAGTAEVTISGEIAPVVIIPTVQTISFDPVPFSQAATVALTGTFSGDSSGSEVTVGIPLEELQNLRVPVPVVSESIGLPPLLPVVTLDFNLATIVFVDISTALVYDNSTPIP